MIIQKKNEKKRTGYLSVFDLNQSLPRPDGQAGAEILFAIIEKESIPISRITLEYEKDIHGGYGKEHFSRQGFLQKYASCDCFRQSGRLQALEIWEIELSEGSLLIGNMGSVVKVLSENEAMDFTRFFTNIEEDTFRYHSFPQQLADDLIQKEGMNLRRAVESLQKLSEYPDIYQEYIAGGKDGAAGHSNPVTVEGYTAERIMQEVKLHPIGAYLMLVKLRKDPEKAKKTLARGIVRK